MNEKYLYLILDILAISVPFFCSFYPKANFSKTWKYLWLALLFPAVVFILWDVYFTRLGVWGFNEEYLTGTMIINLPLEECLFFICIPYACVFTYFSLNHLVKRDIFGESAKWISWILILMLLCIAIPNIRNLYTSVTFIGLAVFLLIHVTILKSEYLGRFYFAFLFILLPFFLINGILTGSGLSEPVVWYNNHENLGLRIGTIPIEDIFYGMLLILMNVTFYEKFKGRS